METEKTFTLTVTEQDLNIISAGIAELPFKVSAALIQKLQGQINEQVQPTSPAE
jgi:hypothetical protein